MVQPRNIDLHLLECFTALMRERNVTRAAEAMGLSQSAMSEALGRLRERFADPLLVRGGRGMQATPRAAELSGQVAEAIAKLRALVAETEPFDPATCTQRFPMVASDYVQLLLMPTLVRRLAKVAPKVAVDLLPINIRRVEQALELGEIDLALAYFVEAPAALKRRHLFTENYVGLARQDHPATRKRLSVAGLASLAHVAVAPSGLNYFSSALDGVLAARGHPRRTTVTSPHFLLAARLVAESDLVLVLPQRAAHALAETLPLSTFPLPVALPTVETAMYWHTRTHHSAAHAWFRAEVAEVLRATGADRAVPAA